MKACILIITLIAIVSCTFGTEYGFQSWEEWQEYKLAYGKQYHTEEEDFYRRAIFNEHARKIAEHNQLYELGEVTYKQAINQWSDISQEEFLLKFTGMNSSLNAYDIQPDPEDITFLTPENLNVPAEMDWRKKGAVTGVMFQGECGSCWTFSATGALEGQYFRKTNKLISLSEQNLLDCSSSYGNNGCRGGFPYKAFQYVQRNGIETERDYPYKFRQYQCRYNRQKITDVRVKGVNFIRRGNENALKEAVASSGPISICIDFNHDSFRHYHSGVYYEPSCSSQYLGHAVLAVGYGTSPRGGDYWIVKNSWGVQWGSGGYIFMARNRRNNCGVATMATFPIV